MADQSQLKAPDVYGRTHQMDENTLGVVAERLEARGWHPFLPELSATTERRSTALAEGTRT